MFLAIHAMLGTLLGINIKSIILVSILAFITHFIFDIIPHWDGHFDKEEFHLNGRITINKKKVIWHILDFLFAIIAIFVLYKEFPIQGILFGCFFAILPDLLKLGYFTKLKDTKIFMSYLNFHSKIQTEVNWRLGLLTQIITTILILMFLL